SVVLAVGSGGLALVIGVASAWLVATCDFPGRRTLEWALVLPLSVPAYIAAYTYAGMLDVTGPVQRAVRALVPSLAESFVAIPIMRIETMVVIFALVLYPYVYLLSRAVFLGQSRTVLEAAWTLGHGGASAFWRVALPLARPAIAAGVSMVVMEVLNDYGAVSYYGVSTFTTGIFRSWHALGDLGAAIRLAAILMAFVFLVLALERSQRGRRRVDDVGGTGHRPLLRQRLRGWRAWAAFAVCFTPLLFGFLIPVAQLAFWSLRTAGDVVDAGYLRLVANSFGLATAAALLCVVIALLLVYAGRLGGGRAVSAANRTVVLGYSIPGAVIAVGVIVPFGWIDRTVDAVAEATLGVSTGLLLSGTLFALVFAYAVRYTAVALLPIEAGFERQCRNLDAAARCLGEPPLMTLWRVALPLLRRTLLAAAILVFVDVMKEIPLTLSLRPFNFDTLATRAYQLAVDEQVAESANAALVIIAVGLLPVLGLDRLLARGRG
ncbi:MAG TPA: iron ABC transporter permease, partial [Nannocystis sp.]